MAKDDRAHTKRGGEVLETLDLEDPIHAYGEEVTRLEFRKLRVRDLVATDEEDGEFAKGALLIARSTDMTFEAVEELTIADFEKASEVVADFFEGSGKRLIAKVSKRRRATKAPTSTASGRRSQD